MNTGISHFVMLESLNPSQKAAMRGVRCGAGVAAQASITALNHARQLCRNDSFKKSEQRKRCRICSNPQYSGALFARTAVCQGLGGTRTTSNATVEPFHPRERQPVTMRDLKKPDAILHFSCESPSRTTERTGGAAVGRRKKEKYELFYLA
ncbi:hypothetical protein E2C01_079546 [Portunus trituberculatus]|uniref:Uncharacterized protein n=1 Tax=Portunus trituberculatus TaxID=210409 RepID=A0A5B7IT23_PORTR|nr:hypothetical protein [Portunus trituberculatus]